jgi:hypothetical protein
MQANNRTLSPLFQYWPLLLGVAAFLILWIVKPPYALLPDNRQILYWYPGELRSGNGLVFNPGQRVLLIAAPAYMLIVAALSVFFVTTNIVQVSEWVFVLALIVGANSLYRISRQAGLSALMGILVSAAYSLSWPLWLGVGTALPVMTALALLAVDLALQERWSWAGITLAVAILSGPEALLLVIPMLFLWSASGKGWRFALALFGPLILALIALRLYYGPSLWDGLLILRPSLSTLPNAVPWLLAIPVILLAGWGWYRRHDNSAVAVLGAWGALHILVIGVLLRVQAGWQYVPLVAVVVLLAAVGLESVKLPVKRIVYAVVAVLLLIPTFSLSTTRNDLRRVTLPDQPLSVGIPSVSQALTLRNLPQQVLISFDGQLQPDLKAMVERGDIQSAVIKYAPDVIIEGGRVTAKTLSSDALARLNYRLVDNNGMYQRQTELGTFTDQAVNTAFGPDIKLVGYALDQSSLAPGRLLRVRLDWEYARPASRPIDIDLRLDSDMYVLAHASDEYVPSVLLIGRWSTYHTLTLSPEAWPGPVTLNVGVIVNGGTVTRVPLTVLNVNPISR